MQGSFLLCLRPPIGRSSSIQALQIWAVPTVWRAHWLTTAPITWSSNAAVKKKQSQYTCMYVCSNAQMCTSIQMSLESFDAKTLLAGHCQTTNLLFFWGSSFFVFNNFWPFQALVRFPYLIFLLRDVRFLMCLCPCLHPPWGPFYKTKGNERWMLHAQVECIFALSVVGTKENPHHCRWWGKTHMESFDFSFQFIHTYDMRRPFSFFHYRFRVDPIKLNF